jgi:tripartite-type tricarboxylate transporter receptor subunit TctC
MYGPPGMAPDLVKRVHGAAASAMTSPDVKDRLTKTGTDAVMSTPEEFAAFMRTEIAKWTKVVKAAKLTID